MTITNPTQTAPSQPAALLGCPPWCTGKHGRPHWASQTGSPGRWHLAASCPGWCIGHTGGSREFEEAGHAGHSDCGTEVTLSLAEPYEAVESSGDQAMRPDSLDVRCYLHPESPEPVIAIMQAATDEWLPEMTPAEAVALAAALVQAAWRVRPEAVRAAGGQEPPSHATGSCPSWCTNGPHEPGDIHISECRAVPAADSRHSCGSTRGPYAVEACGEEGICAQLVASEGDPLAISVHHGDDCLPEMTLGAAEALGWHLLGLACTGRAAAPAE